MLLSRSPHQMLRLVRRVCPTALGRASSLSLTAQATRIIAPPTRPALVARRALTCLAPVQRTPASLTSSALSRVASPSSASHTVSVRDRTTVATAGARRQYATNGSAVWSHLSGDLTAHRAAFTEVPVIDAAPFVSDSPDPAALASSVAALRDACFNVGFFYVVNHGVPWSLVDRTLHETRRFFALPLERKMAIHCADTPNRGYFEMHGENLGEKKVGDYKEGIDIGRHIAAADRAAVTSEHQRRFMAANKWPADLPGFRETMDTYYSTLDALGLKLTRGVALSLGLPARWFDDKLDRAMASLRVLHYPPQTVPVSDEHLGCGPHTDYGVMTILAQDVSGLQVRNRAQQWVEVPVIREAFVVNLGDMTQRWTNDVYVSTPHRAINTTPNRHRYSLPFFYEPNYDAFIEAIPQCVTPSNPARYPPIKFGDHLNNMYVKTYPSLQTPPK